MRQFETKVQELKHSVLRETARLAWEDKLTTGVLDIPEKIIPGPEPSTRCCIYKERAIIGARVKLAMGGDRSNPNVVEVLSVACDECPVTRSRWARPAGAVWPPAVSTPAPRGRSRW